jgi:hypothetical protein
VKDTTTWTVTDDWPDEVPITEAEIEVFEAWFGDRTNAGRRTGTARHATRGSF